MPMLHNVDCEPSYFIVGGLVFMPLSQPFLEMVFGGGRRSRRSDIPVPVLQVRRCGRERKGNVSGGGSHVCTRLGVCVCMCPGKRSMPFVIPTTVLK